jgi:hypothetical protein
MAQQLSDEEFKRLARELAPLAPRGLSDEEFNQFIVAAIREREGQPPAEPSSLSARRRSSPAAPSGAWDPSAPPPYAATARMIPPSTEAGDPINTRRGSQGWDYHTPGEIVGGMAKGALKGAGQTALTLGEVLLGSSMGGRLPPSFLERGVDWAAGEPGFTQRRLGETREGLAPTGPGLVQGGPSPEQFGYGAERAAEFMVPMAGVARATQGANLGRRAMLEGATASTVEGVHSEGDPLRMAAAGTAGVVAPLVGPVIGSLARGTERAWTAVPRAVARAAQGAQEGGFGGAIAGAVRTVAPGQPRTLLIQGLKPSTTATSFPKQLDTAIPELAESARLTGTPITNIETFLTTLDHAKKRIWSQLEGMAGKQTRVSLAKMADAMIESIPKKWAFENPKLAQQAIKRANRFRKSFTLEEAEAFLKETNAEMQSFYGLIPQAQRGMTASNAGVAALEAQAKSLRTVIDDALDAAGGTTGVSRALRQRYGALMEIGRTATRRQMVAARQQPESLSEQIGAVRAAGDMARGLWRVAHADVRGAADLAAATAGRAAAKAIKEGQTTDALIRRAFESYSGRYVPVVP